LKQRLPEPEEKLARFERDWPKNDSARIEEGRLVLTPLTAEEPPEASVLPRESGGRQRQECGMARRQHRELPGDREEKAREKNGRRP
jgi:hypothetical protein